MTLLEKAKKWANRVYTKEWRETPYKNEVDSFMAGYQAALESDEVKGLVGALEAIDFILMSAGAGNISHSVIFSEDFKKEILSALAELERVRGRK